MAHGRDEIAFQAIHLLAMVKIALQNCERVALIINDILDIDKIEW
jgi:energy-converting hydrogenase Eha subunit G